MKKYEVLEHKADLKLRVFGKNKEELFENAAFAMQEFMRPKIKQRATKTERDVEISSPDEAVLLVDFLSEVLYLGQTYRETYNRVKFTKFSDTHISAELSGKRVERFGEDIKAVTHHGLKLHQKEHNLWEATIIFDV